MKELIELLAKYEDKFISGNDFPLRICICSDESGTIEDFDGKTYISFNDMAEAKNKISNYIINNEATRYEYPTPHCRG